MWRTTWPKGVMEKMDENTKMVGIGVHYAHGPRIRLSQPMMLSVGTLEEESVNVLWENAVQYCEVERPEDWPVSLRHECEKHDLWVTWLRGHSEGLDAQVTEALGRQLFDKWTGGMSPWGVLVSWGYPSLLDHIKTYMGKIGYEYEGEPWEVAEKIWRYAVREEWR